MKAMADQTTAPVPGLEDILEAARRISPYIHRTPMLRSQGIDEKAGGTVYFKCENFQKAGAFKSRGACNGVFSLTGEQARRGVCTHSSGNHAQALARAAALRGCEAYIVMPENASPVKVRAVEYYGGRITFCRPTLSSREETLEKVRKETGAIEIHPYNDYRTIAGQATAALELIEEQPGLDLIMAPVGGGGLISGTALAVSYISPGTRVIGAEPEGADDAYRSFISRSFVPSVNPRTIADGLLTSLGSLTFPIILEHVDRILTVGEEDIIRAMRLVMERMKILIEPSSAVPLAALLSHRDHFTGKRTGIILSGGNVNLDQLPWIAT